MRPLSAREQRLIAIGLLVLAVAVVWFAIIAPIEHGFTARAEERARLVDEEARSQSLIGQHGFWRTQARRQSANAADFALTAPNAEAALEAAKARIATAVTTQGGTIKTLREEPGAPGVVRVRAELEVGLTQLMASLKLIESQKPYVLVEKLSIAADQAATAGRLSPMEVSIDLAVPYNVAQG